MLAGGCDSKFGAIKSADVRHDGFSIQPDDSEREGAGISDDGPGGRDQCSQVAVIG